MLTLMLIINVLAFFAPTLLYQVNVTLCEATSMQLVSKQENSCHISFEFARFEFQVFNDKVVIASYLI